MERGGRWGGFPQRSRAKRFFVSAGERKASDADEKKRQTYFAEAHDTKQHAPRGAVVFCAVRAVLFCAGCCGVCGYYRPERLRSAERRGGRFCRPEA